MKKNNLGKSDAGAPGATYRALCAEWLDNLRSRGLSSASVAVYGAGLKHLGRALERDGVDRVVDITASLLRTWHAAVDRETAPTSANLFIRTVRRFFAWLGETGRIFENPAQSLPVPKVPRPQARCPSPAQMAELLDGSNDATVTGLRDLALLELAYSSAARLAELQRLDVSSLDLEHGTVRIQGKGGHDRMAPVGRRACECLRRYLSEARPLLSSPEKMGAALWVAQDGGRLGRMGVSAAIKRRAAALGLALSPHDLRRAAATHSLQNGMPLAFVKDLLGHQTYRHLRHYLRQCPHESQVQLRRTKPLAR